MDAVILGEPMVQVRCIWPASRGTKDDCRGKTKTVWSGHGDIQAYPARLWPLLAAHADVWELADARVAAEIGRTDAQEDADRAKKVAMAHAIIAEADAEDKRRAEAEANRRAQLEAAEAEALQKAMNAQQAIEEASGKNTDVVSATPNSGTGAVPPPGGTEKLKFASVEALDAANDDSIRAVALERGYALNPRLNPVNLRLKFMEAQAADERVEQPAD